MKQFIIALVVLMCSSLAADASCDLLAKFNYSTKAQTLTLQNRSSGNYTALEWNFGDGHTSKETNPKHTYDKSGMYTFTLTIFNEEGCSETFEAKVYIFDLKQEEIATEPATPTEEEVETKEIEEHQAIDNQLDTDSDSDQDNNNLFANLHDHSASIAKTFLDENNVGLRAYPNPVAEQATIQFNLPNTKDVRVQVFDMMGKRVRLLAAETMMMGTHELHFEREELVSGTYLLSVDTGSQTFTQKMIIQ